MRALDVKRRKAPYSIIRHERVRTGRPAALIAKIRFQVSDARDAGHAASGAVDVGTFTAAEIDAAVQAVAALAARTPTGGRSR